MRAPINERKDFKSVGLPPRLWEFVKLVGNGHYAHGIRYIVEQSYKAQEAGAAHSRGDSQGIES